MKDMNSLGEFETVQWEQKNEIKV